MYRFCRNSPIFSVFICKIPIYAREIFKVLRDLLIYSDLYPLLEKGGIYISGAAVAAPSAPFRAVGLRAARRRVDGANAYRTGR